MSEVQRIEADRELLRQAQSEGVGPTLRAYVRLSGPGWLQSAITLGGGTLASCLYLGALAGFGMLWLQPIAMVLGIIMLSAIGYVTLSTGERPFRAINVYVNPVLGWAWALASLVASMVWCMPQFSLANAVVQQNLLPGLLGAESALGDFNGKLVITLAILAFSTAITWAYDSGGRGIRAYEWLLKAMVAMIVLCFAGVVLKLSFSSEAFAWGDVLAGFVPDLSKLYEPAASFGPLLDNVPAEHRDFWVSEIVSRQRDVMISAAAASVGINMTFLFPYSLLRRGWTREFRGLSVFDLWTGMFIPFTLATSFVIIAAANQFHAKPLPLADVQKDKRLAKEYDALMRKRLQAEVGAEALARLPEAEVRKRIDAAGNGEKALAATLLNRDAFNLARSLEGLTGPVFANVVFGLGVLGMTLSTITLLMLISGFVVCEMIGVEPTGWPLRLGSLLGAAGALGPFIWGSGNAQFYLAVPTSIFGFTLLPIAYLTFFLLMNRPRLLGPDLPRGGRRVLWNVSMAVAAGTATAASAYAIWDKAGIWGVAAAAGLFVLALVVHLMRR